MQTTDEAPYHLLIRDLPANERPRERLQSLGARALSTAELLAILLRVGRPQESAITMAGRLLSTFGGLPGLNQAAFDELARQAGVGAAKTAQIKAALEVGRRLATVEPDARVVISSPEDAYNIVSGEMAHLEQEHLRVILLNTKNQVMAVAEVSRGTVNSTLVRPAEVFREAVRRTCPALIIVHNHPSGDTTPSEEDASMTHRLVAAGKQLDIEVVDHIIVGRGRYASLRERRVGF